MERITVEEAILQWAEFKEYISDSKKYNISLTQQEIELLENYSQAKHTLYSIQSDIRMSECQSTQNAEKQRLRQELSDVESRIKQYEQDILCNEVFRAFIEDNNPPSKKAVREKIAAIRAKENNKKETTEKSFDRPFYIIKSKRFAAIVSLLLCIVLYLSCLTLVFTTKRDTYICYTTKTGECFHSATCKYLNTSYETTVYEASQKYKMCKYCNPCVEKYETTIIVRDYISPLLISLPISALAFVILTFKKKPE